jgi:hypothetical protein
MLKKAISRRIFILQKLDAMRNFGCRQRGFVLIMDSGRMICGRLPE